MFLNHTSRQIIAKIVYYGPGLCGKTTNLQYIFSVTNPKSRGELVSIQTQTERTLFFDLLPIDVGFMKGYDTKFYDTTRRMVLKGADGIVFVADSQKLMADANTDSLINLNENMDQLDQNLNETPLVMQYNKRDLESILSIKELNNALNPNGFPYFESIAKTGKGVLETLKEISGMTLQKITELIGKEEAKTVRYYDFINFDTDPSMKIISRDKLPMKKIAVENIESISSKSSLGNENLMVGSTDVNSMSGKKNKKDIMMSKSLSMLNDLEDKSRITVLKKIHPGKSKKMTMEIKDDHGQIIDTIQIEIKPDTKKITLILDVK
jgi:GTPase SAR1 family protein